jgi:hypothetical protein
MNPFTKRLKQLQYSVAAVDAQREIGTAMLSGVL